MSILDINKKNNEKQLRKTIWAYLILSVVAIVVDKVYGIFAHGVDSAAMTWMFLYPLLGGALFCFIIQRLIPHITKFTGCRVFLNVHNSGIATLTFASLLKGIFEIAGTNSTYLVYYYMTGGVFIAASLIIMLIMALNRNRVHV
ncbi:hypothetical protein CLMAG_55050 [Clostridium magnum DSM 2767]|uniref:Uncharacterized protein n=1 Tax=Clostridium magnum DSM 2767 TaxID=1121326 RepID=A0A161YGJ0_9CLOT|nr:hypothetical protein [Clostridium magnum]KZL89282.1 hypothetical protein CLMAG_55050 [Clostridium magnum DSM 2767]SHI96101.1 hypothetical protein SAMN02745944_05130 [Clostridium magnum DSM 2767]